MWLTHLVALIISISTSFAVPLPKNSNEWTNNVIYQVYPRSFKDSNGDGIGDIPGITSKLEHLIDAGADTLYLSPIYPSPMKDFGYDVTNHTSIASEYGTMDDFDNLVIKAKKLGLKIILDFIPNHTSDEHEWFLKSIDRIKPYDDYYVWVDAKRGPNGERLPPTNWLSHPHGSAWEWNEKRQQYFYHEFIRSQPDLNYRNPKVKEEMDKILTFWMERGVDGFRVDAPNHLYEDEELRDEPKLDVDFPEDDRRTLEHIYCRDLNENYEVIRSWRYLLDKYAHEHETSQKYLILETWGRESHVLGYYNVGADPFNFRLLFDVTNTSTAEETKEIISAWLNAIPEGEVTNWIAGNHDNHRIASRYGKNGERADQMTMITMILPGIAMVYYGEEIGMRDRPMSWEETKDPYGCDAGKERYHLVYRDAERTPFQWDGNISAGFSDSSVTWLPVHENHKTLNLASQKEAEVSHFKVFQDLTSLKRSSEILKHGSTEILASENVLAIVRRLVDLEPITLLINFNDSDVEIDAKSWLNIPEKVQIYTASVSSGLKKGEEFHTSKLRLPGAASVILR
ncbi:hypothetical protein QAD02_005070 [Eretmocerus hayati]|uniref:Uncharacterized protein n=1 Tax=Eretmocerus hayati TaxID=131215 RepID=A0ACC2NRH1_9HYME|nr:hypothetical protein QAD02_005070 [Eretmocerus hayati]